ncbi:hypothetical protein PoB_005486200 [Plakobranchus ocellatus]|uniref:Uncharacterized protein n=1 Tax=Plakobranchus ocellatus TaxID=259542 RepID=A0AAV4CAF8_9GAST|nr:hypothetical protein PoB_005486200 [Plakobranchus ocellatus]
MCQSFAKGLLPRGAYIITVLQKSLRHPVTLIAHGQDRCADSHFRLGARTASGSIDGICGQPSSTSSSALSANTNSIAPMGTYHRRSKVRVQSKPLPSNHHGDRRPLCRLPRPHVNTITWRSGDDECECFPL